MKDRNERPQKECRQLLIECIDEILRPYGFRRKGRNWTRSLDRIIQRVYLMKSDWGDQYYFENLIIFPELDYLKGDRLYDIRIRLTELAGEDSNGFHEKAVLNCEYEMQPSERQEELRRYVLKYGCPFIEKSSTIDGLRELMGQAFFEHTFGIAARTYLSSQ